MPTKHFCDECGIELGCQWWHLMPKFEMLCRHCYATLKAKGA